jgi:predicted transcriptional regulator
VEEMDHETLFTATKWDILKTLERGAQSPIEIAKQLNSSLANISQQLRLLEMAGVVTSKRVSNRDKDKPRILYSLAGNLSYLIATSDKFVDKKLLSLSERNKVVLHIWFLDDQHIRYALEQAFWQIEKQLEQITKLTFVGVEKGVPVLEVAGDVKAVKLHVSGQFSEVELRVSTTPKGQVLYER